MAKSKSKNISSTDLFSIHFVPSLIVFLVMLLLIGYSWRTATQTIIQTRSEEVNVRSLLVEDNIKQRINSYDNALQAGAGFISASNGVSRDEWQIFVNKLNIEERFPAMIGFGYVELVTDSTLQAYKDKINKENPQILNFRPNNLGTGSYATVTYLEPQNERNRSFIGADVFTDISRTQAIEYSRDQGKSSVSDVIEITQPDNVTKINGITIYNPVYKSGTSLSTLENRRQAIIGYTYTPLRADILFGEIFA